MYYSVINWTSSTQQNVPQHQWGQGSSCFPLAAWLHLLKCWRLFVSSFSEVLRYWWWSATGSCRLNPVGARCRGASPSESPWDRSLWCAAGWNCRNLSRISRKISEPHNCTCFADSKSRHSFTYLGLRGPVTGARMWGSVIVFMDVLRCDGQAVTRQISMLQKSWHVWKAMLGKPLRKRTNKQLSSDISFSGRKIKILVSTEQFRKCKNPLFCFYFLALIKWNAFPEDSNFFHFEKLTLLLKSRKCNSFNKRPR